MSCNFKTHYCLVRKGERNTAGDRIKWPKRTRMELRTPPRKATENHTFDNNLLVRLVSKGLVQVPVKKEEGIKPTKAQFNLENHKVKRLVDLDDRNSLRIAQPGLVEKLYEGMQCSGCSMRFPTTDTSPYSRHLDWHIRQNRRERLAFRRARTRQWYYIRADWLQYEELNDADPTDKSWFEATQDENLPSVVAGAIAGSNCWFCGEKFDMFYNDDEQWHLKNCLRSQDRLFHRDCFDRSSQKHEKTTATATQAKLTADNNESRKCDMTIEADDDVVLLEEPVQEVVVSDSDADDDSQVPVKRRVVWIERLQRMK